MSFELSLDINGIEVPFYFEVSNYDSLFRRVKSIIKSSGGLFLSLTSTSCDVLY